MNNQELIEELNSQYHALNREGKTELAAGVLVELTRLKMQVEGSKSPRNENLLLG